tara:strand:- start:350 stop:1207 length:858 start_codon:yes stop_codon:yes gene_type:complete
MGFKDNFKNKSPLQVRSAMKYDEIIDENSPEYWARNRVGESEDNEEQPQEEYEYQEYEKTGKNKPFQMMPGIIGKAHKQRKWWKYGAGFGTGWGGGRQLPSNATPAQKLQKSLGDELYTRANRMVATMADDSTSAGAAQGIHFEGVYRTPEFQAYMARELTNFARKHGTEAANQINVNLWEGYDYHADGTMSHGKDLSGSGITKERAKWKQGKFRAPTDKERKAYADDPRYKSLDPAVRATMHGGSPEDMIKYYADGDKKKERKLRKFFKKNPELFEGLSTDPYS